MHYQAGGIEEASVLTQGSWTADMVIFVQKKGYLIKKLVFKTRHVREDIDKKHGEGGYVKS